MKKVIHVKRSFICLEFCAFIKRYVDHHRINTKITFEQLKANEDLKKAPHVKALLGFLKEYPDMRVEALEIQKASEDYLDHIIMRFKPEK